MELVIRIMVGLAMAALAALLALVIRRRLLRGRVGTFDCSLRRARRGWVFGMARYSASGLEWYRVFSFSPRPRVVYPRRDLTVRGQRLPHGAEAMALLAGVVIVECGVAGLQVELGMTPSAATGFLSWLESAPPGHHLVA